MAQLYFTIGPMYRGIWVLAFLTTRHKSVTSIAIVAVMCLQVCIQNVELLLGHRHTRLFNIEATLVDRPVVAEDAGVEL